MYCMMCTCMYTIYIHVFINMHSSPSQHTHTKISSKKYYNCVCVCTHTGSMMYVRCTMMYRNIVVLPCTIYMYYVPVLQYIILYTRAL